MKHKSKRVKYYSDEKVLDNFYKALTTGNSIKLLRVHIPRSEVFYAREAYYQYSGEWVSLDRMERCMYLEGMLKAKDVFEPERKRDWE
jgi:hypothetical protein